MKARHIVLATAAFLTGALFLFRKPWEPSPPAGAAGAIATKPDPNDLTHLFLQKETESKVALERDFGPELASTAALTAVDAFWDRLNAVQDPLPVLLDRLPATLPWDASAGVVEGWTSRGWTRNELSAFLLQQKAAGWRLRRSRWELVSFTPTPPSSRIRAELCVENENGGERAQLQVEFIASGATGVLDDCERWTGIRGSLRRGSRRPAFDVAAELPIPVPPHTAYVDPLIAVPRRDRPVDDLLLVGAALWMRNEPDGWRFEPLTGLPPEPVWATAATDWNQDGEPDLILAGRSGLRWLAGPRWQGPGEVIWVPPQPWLHPQVIAVGDIDRDGDADLFIGQYKLPYRGGQFPTPYHDANDGFASTLLIQEGPGRLRDATSDWGLGRKNRRRIYSASFADWDDDDWPDLVIVSDFAGVDLFRNTGKGSFEDRTETLGDARHLFGMAHLTGDFNRDGRTDLYAIGMGSSTARRLDALGLFHAGWPEDRRYRPAMTYGNRLFLGTAQGLRMGPTAAEAASGGWAWAVSGLDVDNNGWMDFHLCQGHETRASVQDYDRQFWLQDIHAANSTNDPVADMFFRNGAGRRAADRASYGGWQMGGLLMQREGGHFDDDAWLEGSAVLADTRNGIPFSLDGDGRMDLAVCTFEEWPQRRQRLVILQNRHPSPGSWIGFEVLPPSAEGRVVVESSGRRLSNRLTPGESYRSQALGRFHLGLGDTARIDQVEYIVPGHPPQKVEGWHVGRWNQIKPSARAAAGQ